MHTSAFIIALVLSPLALSAGAAPAGQLNSVVSDNFIYTVAHLNADGSESNGHGAELAYCLLTTDDWTEVYSDLLRQFLAADVHIASYAGYQTVKELNLHPDSDKDTAAAIFVELCEEHKGYPHQDI